MRRLFGLTRAEKVERLDVPGGGLAANVHGEFPPDEELLAALRAALLNPSTREVDGALIEGALGAISRRRASLPDWPADVARPLMPQLPEKVERCSPSPLPSENGYQPITFDKSPGVPPQGGTGTARPLLHDSLWPAGMREGFAVPVSSHLVLGLPFFLHVHNILDEAEEQMRAGEACSLDYVADLIAVKVRENLFVVYERSAEGR